MDGDRVLFEALEVWVHLDARESWRGDFALPRDKHIDTAIFRLIANDGREGDIRIEKVSTSDYGDTLVNFQGRGRFEKPLP